MKKGFVLFLFILSLNIAYSQNDSIANQLIYKQFFYPNGVISSEGYLKNNVPMGYWKSYYVTGVKKSEGKWTNNKLDSIWIFYDQFGDTIEKINYYKGKKNGYQYKFYTNDKSKNKIYKKELYVNGKKNDKSLIYYETGELYQIVGYKDDIKQGLSYQYAKNKNIISVIRYRNNEIIDQENINRYNLNHEKEGIWREYYKNGNIKEEKSYVNDKLDGYYKTYGEDGNLIEAIKYKNGEMLLESESIGGNIEIKEKYDAHENLIFQGAYKNEIPIGIHRYFNSKGKVIKSETYNINGNRISEGIVLKNGIEDGDWIYYFDNGNKQAIGKYINGNKSGNWNYYYKNEKLKQTGTYVNGKFSGRWQWYYQTGELLKEEFFIYGKLDGESIEYSVDGNIIAKGNYVEGLKEGEWIYSIGDQEQKGKYIMDLRDGNWESYYLNQDILSFEGRYIQGNEDGKHIYYYPNGKIKEEKYYNEGKKVRSWSKYNEKGDLIIAIQFKDGKEFKINGVKVKLDTNEN